MVTYVSGVSVDQSAAESRGPNSNGDVRFAGVAGQLSELSRSLQAEPDVAGTLQAITAAAVINIPGADYAAITLLTRGGKITTPAASNGAGRAGGTVAGAANQGPCLGTAREHRTFLSNDVASEARWPHFARAAADLGVGSMLSFQLYVQAENLGALNVPSGARVSEPGRHRSKPSAPPLTASTRTAAPLDVAYRGLMQPCWRVGSRALDFNRWG